MFLLVQGMPSVSMISKVFDLYRSYSNVKWGIVNGWILPCDGACTGRISVTNGVSPSSFVRTAHRWWYVFCVLYIQQELLE